MDGACSLLWFPVFKEQSLYSIIQLHTATKHTIIVFAVCNLLRMRCSIELRVHRIPI